VRGHSYYYIKPVTQEVRDRIEKVALGNWLSAVPAGPSNGWKNPSLAVMRAMKAAYDAAVAKPDSESDDDA
jgi:hypothetical protein